MLTKHAFNIDTAFVSRETPSLATCIARLNEDAGLSSDRKRDLVSGLTRISEALGKDPAQIPADPTWLQPRIAALSPARLGVTPKKFANIVSNAKAALAQSGITPKRTRSLADLRPEWRRLWEALLASKNHTLTRGLGRFIRFLDINDVAPDDVCLAHIDNYREALVCNALRKDPAESTIQALYAWNRAARLLPVWPKITLVAPKRSRNYVLPTADLPASLTAEITTLLARLADPDPLDPESYRRALAPDTVDSRRGQLLRFASALILSGLKPSDLSGLIDLVTPAHLEQGLRWILARQGDQLSPSLSNMCLCLRMVARHVVRLSDDDQARVEKIFSKLIKPQRRGMTAKNRDRLRSIDEDNLVRLYTLPDCLWARAAVLQQPYKAALIAEEAIAIAILFYCPIRRKNLSQLHLERDFQRLGKGRVLLQISESRAKNGIAPCFELPSYLVEWINRHVAHRAGLLCPAGTPFLFPKRHGSAPIIGGQLGSRISARIRKETGLAINSHLFRHLSAREILREKPGYYEVVRRILGHSETSTTYAAYVGFEADDATRLLADVINRQRGKDK